MPNLAVGGHTLNALAESGGKAASTLELTMRCDSDGMPLLEVQRLHRRKQSLFDEGASRKPTPRLK